MPIVSIFLALVFFVVIENLSQYPNLLECGDLILDSQESVETRVATG